MNQIPIRDGKGHKDRPTMLPAAVKAAEKDQENQEKHGVTFAKAQLAFADPTCVIGADLSHSARENR